MASSKKSKAGRPLKFKTVKELQDKIDAYFAECDPHWIDVMEWVQKRSNGKLVYDEDGAPVQILVTKKQRTKQIPYTITGLALSLDTTRETLLDYENKYTIYSDTIKKAKMRCHNYAEAMLFNSNATGPIFNLKNNYAWQDKSVVDDTGEKKIIVETRRFKGK